MEAEGRGAMAAGREATVVVRVAAVAWLGAVAVEVAPLEAGGCREGRGGGPRG